MSKGFVTYHGSLECEINTNTVFVYGLFNDSVSSLDYVVLNNWITEYLIAIIQIQIPVSIYDL